MDRKPTQTGRDPRFAGTLVTVVNDPRGEQRGWWNWGSRSDLGWQAPPPPLDPAKYPNIKRKDLEHYLRTVRGAHQEFLHDRESLTEATNRQLLLEGIDPSSAAGPSHSNQGDGLAQALLRVPALFFQEDFTVERSGLLQGADSMGELAERIETLTGYLDVVETQLMREVALRSRNVFHAAAEVSTIHQELCGALGNIKALRERLGDVDEGTYASACTVVALQTRRRNVAATVDMLQSVEEVASSKGALQLLLDGQDYAGALDLLEVVVHNMEANCNQGLQAFSQTLPQMRETRELLESLLACEFVSLAHFSQANAVMDVAIARVAAAASTVPSSGAEADAAVTSPRSGAGLLGFPDTEAQAAAREQLHDKLLPIVLALLRVDKLAGALQQLRDNVTAATKALVHEVMERMMGPTGLPHLQQQAAMVSMSSAPPMMLSNGSMGGGSGRQDGVPGAGGMSAAGGPDGYGMQGQSQMMQAASMQPGIPGSQQAGTGGAGGSGADHGMAAVLQGLRQDGFMQVLSVIHAVIEASLGHQAQVSSIIRDDILRAAKVPAAAATNVARGAAAVTQALADTASSRWVKLIGARASLVPKLKLYEFQSLADACEIFAALLEPHSARAAASVRTAIQGQCRSFLEALHARNVAQLQHLLEVEQWTATDVPPTFQDIVDRLLARTTNTPSAAGQPGSLLRAGSHRSRVSNMGTPTSMQSIKGGRDQPMNSHSHEQQQHHASQQGSHPAPPGGGLALHNKRFPLVNTTLMLLKLLDEYMALADTSPLYSVEIGHHVCDLVKVFNTQACQLVLGAGAVKTAGLKSISAKHLALSCESCYLLARLVPILRAAFLLMGSASAPGAPSLEPRRHMLLLEFEKVQQDLTVHTNEIHSKLVDIMQDRLVAAARQLTAEAPTWGASNGMVNSNGTKPSAGGSSAAAAPFLPPGFEPCASMRSLAKQLGTLQAVLIPILQQEELQYIFGRVASLYSEALAVTLDSLPQRDGAAWEEARRCNALFALQCLQGLPLEPTQAPAYLSRLSTFYTKHYGHFSRTASSTTTAQGSGGGAGAPTSTAPPAPSPVPPPAPAPVAQPPAGPVMQPTPAARTSDPGTAAAQGAGPATVPTPAARTSGPGTSTAQEVLQPAAAALSHGNGASAQSDSGSTASQTAAAPSQEPRQAGQEALQPATTAATPAETQPAQPSVVATAPPEFFLPGAQPQPQQEQQNNEGSSSNGGAIETAAALVEQVQQAVGTPSAEPLSLEAAGLANGHASTGGSEAGLIVQVGSREGSSEGGASASRSSAGDLLGDELLQGTTQQLPLVQGKELVASDAPAEASALLLPNPFDGEAAAPYAVTALAGGASSSARVSQAGSMQSIPSRDGLLATGNSRGAAGSLSGSQASLVLHPPAGDSGDVSQGLQQPQQASEQASNTTNVQQMPDAQVPDVQDEQIVQQGSAATTETCQQGTGSDAGSNPSVVDVPQGTGTPGGSLPGSGRQSMAGGVVSYQEQLDGAGTGVVPGQDAGETQPAGEMRESGSASEGGSLAHGQEIVHGDSHIKAEEEEQSHPLA